jgi:MFS family permease
VAAATLLSSFLIGALLIHQVPILTGKGLTRETAAWLAATSGFASLFGKLCTGWLFDRSRSGFIGGISLSLPAIGCGLLLQPSTSFGLILCAMLILGYAAGAYLQLCTYLTSRYAGVRHFGKIFGVMASLMALGTGVGPVVGGMVFDYFHSYTPLLIGIVPTALVCGALVTRLGEYPDFNESAHAQMR